MKFSALMLFSLLLLFINPREVFGSVDVTISGNGESSSSRVSIKNNVSNSTKGEDSSDSSVDIRIETDGEVKEFHGKGNQDIKLESGNGKNSVSIFNNSSGSQTSSSNSFSSNTSVSTKVNKEESSSSPTPNSSKSTQKKEEDNSLFDFIKREIELIFSLFSFNK